MIKTETQKTPVKKILRELGKLKEYYYPTGADYYSLFILPDGRMVGTEKLGDHDSMFEKILKRKLNSTQEFVDILVSINCVKIIISSGPALQIDIVTPPTTKQKYTLKDLAICGKYEVYVDNLIEYAPDAPSRNYCRRLLKLPIY